MEEKVFIEETIGMTRDDCIAYWAEIYHAIRLSEEGVPFEAFAQAPHEYLGA